ncbi:JAB domain-containing protein [Chitinimonas sp.]|uniref:JAB domain-containing protein n=1 Tax=Chitinimonas sp. TaxID=1934313 RepID=UPI002F926B70
MTANTSQFKSSQASFIGETIFAPESGSCIYDPESNRFWLRSGTVALSSLYPRAAGKDHLMVHGIAQITLPASVGVTGFAHNGAGTAIACYGDSINVLRTSDYGASWNLVAHGISGTPVTDVCWNGVRFIAVGNVTGNYNLGWSTTGAAGSWTSLGGPSLTSATADTARIQWNGSIALGVVSGDTKAFTTADGTVPVSRVLPQVVTNPRIEVLPSLVAGQWYVAGSTTAAVQSTAADGSAWATPVYGTKEEALKALGNLSDAELEKRASYMIDDRRQIGYYGGEGYEPEFSKESYGTRDEFLRRAGLTGLAGNTTIAFNGASAGNGNTYGGLGASATNIAKTGEDKGKGWTDEQDAAVASTQPVFRNGLLDEDVKEALYSGGQSAVVQAPGIVMAALARNPGIAMAYGAMSAAGPKYSETREAGYDVPSAVLAAAEHGGTEYITEKLPMEHLFAAYTRGGGSLARLASALKAAGAEVPNELLATTLQNATDQRYGLGTAADARGNDVQRRAGDWAQYLESLPKELRDTALSTMAMTGVMSGPALIHNTAKLGKWLMPGDASSLGHGPNHVEDAAQTAGQQEGQLKTDDVQIPSRIGAAADGDAHAGLVGHLLESLVQNGSDEIQATTAASAGPVPSRDSLAPALEGQLLTADEDDPVAPAWPHRATVGSKGNAEVVEVVPRNVRLQYPPQDALTGDASGLSKTGQYANLVPTQRVVVPDEVLNTADTGIPRVLMALGVASQSERGTTHDAASEKAFREPNRERGMSVNEVTDGLGSRLSKVGDIVKVVQSEHDLPDALQAQIKPGGNEGIYWSGNTGRLEDARVWLVADHLPSLKRANEVLSHELIGHYAQERLVDGKEFTRALNSIEKMEAAGSKLVKELALRVDSTQPKLRQEAPRTRTKEILAQAVETGAYKKSPTLARLVADMSRAVKAGLRKLGFRHSWVNALTAEEVFSLLREGERRLEMGQRPKPMRDAAAPSRPANRTAYSRLTGSEKGALTPSEVDAEINTALYRKREEEIDQDEARFLSDAPEGNRYPRSTRLLKRIRKASDAAAAELGGDATKPRSHVGALGAFRKYAIRGEIVEGDAFNPGGLLLVKVYGDKQYERGLTDEAALTFTVNKTGELIVNGPSPSGRTFVAFNKLGWAAYARGGDGSVEPGWSTLTDPDRPGEPLPVAQLLPLLADVHARVRAWRADDHVGLHWSRSTGATGGFDDVSGESHGRNTAVYFSRQALHEAPEGERKSASPEPDPPRESSKREEVSYLYRQVKTRPGTTVRQRETGRAALADLQSLKGNAGERGVSRRSPVTRTLAEGLERGFVEAGGNELNGQQIRTPGDLAALAQVMRDPRFETLRVFFTDSRGRIVGSMVLTSRLPGVVFPAANYVQQIAKHKAEFGASGYWLLHNHPNGRAAPSTEDVAHTRKLARAVSGLHGHVIIDHNEYAQILPGRDGGWEQAVIDAPELAAVDFYGQPHLPHPMLGRQANQPRILADIAKQLQIRNGYLVLIGTDYSGRVRMATEVAIGILRGERGRRSQLLVMAEIRRLTRDNGAGGYLFAVVPGDPMHPDYAEQRNDGVLHDVVGSGGASALAQHAMAESRYAETRADRRGKQAKFYRWERTEERERTVLDTPAFQQWFAGSVATENGRVGGEPKPYFHAFGDGPESIGKLGPIWVSEDSGHGNGGRSTATFATATSVVYLRVARPFELGSLPGVSMADVLDKAIRQATAFGYDFDAQAVATLRKQIKAQWEQAGRLDAPLWVNGSWMGGNATTEVLRSYLRALGFDALRYHHHSVETFGVFSPYDVSSAPQSEVGTVVVSDPIRHQPPSPIAADPPPDPTDISPRETARQGGFSLPITCEKRGDGTLKIIGSEEAIHDFLKRWKLGALRQMPTNGGVIIARTDAPQVEEAFAWTEAEVGLRPDHPILMGPQLENSGVVKIRALKNATPEQIRQVMAFVAACNDALLAGALSPTGRVSTLGKLRRAASWKAFKERMAAKLAGRPYTGVVGHVPDTTWMGIAQPYSWMDLDSRVNSSIGAQVRRYAIGYKPTMFVFDGGT